MGHYQLAQKYQLNQRGSEIESALKLMADQHVFLLGVSGKICSGKDTIAPLIMDAIGYTNAQKLSFADDLKKELSRIIEIIDGSPTPLRAHHEILKEMKPKVGPHHEIIRLLYQPVKDGLVKDGHTRGPEFREAIQLWATQVRRAEDPNYWVKKTVSNAIDTVNRGQSVYISDVRFANEAQAITDLTGRLIRLDITPEEQLRRIVNRDGKEPNNETLSHISETELDDYSFALRISVDGKSTEEIVEIALSA